MGVLGFRGTGGEEARDSRLQGFRGLGVSGSWSG